MSMELLLSHECDYHNVNNFIEFICNADDVVLGELARRLEDEDAEGIGRVLLNYAEQYWEGEAEQILADRAEDYYD